MRALIITIAGLLAGYIIGNLEYKTLEQIIKKLSEQSSKWVYVIKNFIGETLNDFEGFDSDEIKINIDAFVDELSKKLDKFSEMESYNEKIIYVEKEIKNITNKLIEKNIKIKK